MDDVLDRFYQAAQTLSTDHIVRLTGDCPLADPDVIDEVIFKHLIEDADYTSNCCPPTFPDGLDVEIFKYSVLVQSWKNAHLPSHREHVTLFIREKVNNYQLANYEGDIDLSHLRWTVDEAEDFDFVTNIYKALYKENYTFKTKDILNLLKNKPGISLINSKFQRNEGLVKSQKQDNIFLNGEH